MRKDVFVVDVEADRFVETIVQVAMKSTGHTRTGERYARLVVRDKTGELQARIWAGAPALEVPFEEGDFVWIQARSEAWKGDVQLNIADLVRLDRDAVQLADYMPTSRFDPHVMRAHLDELVETHVRSVWVRAFIAALFKHPDIQDAFSLTPAAIRNHHATLSGLLEHVLSMARLALATADHYERYYPNMIDRDLLIVGVIVHDIGKVYELQYNGDLRYTTHGSLVGHIVSGAALVQEVARSIEEFPETLTTLIQHCVVSHHGKLEYGSPRPPQTIEAFLLHQIDMIDSRLNTYSALLPKARDLQTHRSAHAPTFQTTMHIPPVDGYDWSNLPNTDPDSIQSPGATAPSLNPPHQPPPHTTPPTHNNHSPPQHTLQPALVEEPSLFQPELAPSQPNPSASPKPPISTELPPSQTPEPPPPTPKPHRVPPRPAPHIPLLAPKRTMRNLTHQNPPTAQDQLSLLSFQDSPSSPPSSDSL